MHRIRLSKRLENFTVRVDLELGERVTGLYGPSGSGKTTILNCVAGLLAPEAGAISVNGETLFADDRGINVATRKRRIGYVFQDGLCFEHMTVAGNLAYARHDRQGPDADQAIEVLELGELLHRKGSALSGGEKRRVAIGRALLSAPRLLLLDEPLAGLDRRLAGKTLSYIRTVLDTFDLPAVYVSHWVSDIIFLCDEVVVLREGRNVAQGPPASLVGVMESIEPLRPPALKNIFTAGVTEVDKEAGVIRCDLHGQCLTIMGGAAPDASSVTAMIAARDIILAPKLPEVLSARNVLRGSISRIEQIGTHRVIFIDVGVEWMVEVTRQAVEELRLAPGGDIFAVVKASAIQCVDART